MKYLTLANAAWLLLYLVVMCAGLYGLARARSWALDVHGPTNEKAGQRQADWEEWRSTAAEQASSGPVQRKVPRSSEPPTLVLLRDYYGMCVSAFVLFGSVLFGASMFMVRGMFAAPGRVREDK